MRHRKDLPTRLTHSGIGLLWFDRCRTSKGGKDTRPVRNDIALAIARTFSLPTQCDLEGILAQSFIPNFAAFGALPFSIYQTTPGPHPRSVRLMDAFRTTEATESGLHIATVCDLLWLLPQMGHMLSPEAVFFAPKYGVRSHHADKSSPGETTDASVFYLERTRVTTSSPVQRWRVEQVYRHGRRFHGPVPVVLLTYVKPSIPRLSIHEPTHHSPNGVANE